MSVKDLQNELYSLGNPSKAEDTSRFFKTVPGSYGEHDRFLGISVPEIRKLAKTHQTLSEDELSEFLSSSFNDERLLALLILRFQYEKADLESKKAIVNFYIDHISAINNWNLVDLSAPYIVGDFAVQTNADLLFRLAESENMWSRRIAIVASHAFIQNYRYDVTLKLAEQFLQDSEDLMYKATGWMLREVGKRDESVLCSFLDQHREKMPRTMLRCAIERFEEGKRKEYLKRSFVKKS